MTTAGDLVVHVEMDDAGTVVAVEGDLDLATSGQLEDALDTCDLAGKVVVDLTRCEFLDSSGLRVLLTAASRSSEAGGRIALVAADPRILRVLELAGVESQMPIHTTRADAL